MKLLTKEEEEAHYRATLTGGAVGLGAGLAFSGAALTLASRRSHFVRTLTLPLKAFVVTSGGTFGGIIAADHASRAFESERNPIDREYRESEAQKYTAERAGMTFTERALAFGKQERYKIVGASWVASMGVAWSLVNRNPYLTGAQKLVQARVYAQFLTLGVLIATAVFEIQDQRRAEGRWETVMIVDPKDPEHKKMIEERRRVGGTDDAERPSGDTLWKDMVAAEEERLKERDDYEKRIRHEKNGKSKKHSPPKEKDHRDDDEGQEEKKKAKK